MENWKWWWWRSSGLCVSMGEDDWTQPDQSFLAEGGIVWRCREGIEWLESKFNSFDAWQEWMSDIKFDARKDLPSREILGQIVRVADALLFESLMRDTINLLLMKLILALPYGDQSHVLRLEALQWWEEQGFSSSIEDSSLRFSSFDCPLRREYVRLYDQVTQPKSHRKVFRRSKRQSRLDLGIKASCEHVDLDARAERVIITRRPPEITLLIPLKFSNFSSSPWQNWHLSNAGRDRLGDTWTSLMCPKLRVQLFTSTGTTWLPGFRYLLKYALTPPEELIFPSCFSSLDPKICLQFATRHSWFLFPKDVSLHHESTSTSRFWPPAPLPSRTHHHGGVSLEKRKFQILSFNLCHFNQLYSYSNQTGLFVRHLADPILQDIVRWKWMRGDRWIVLIRSDGTIILHRVSIEKSGTPPLHSTGPTASTQPLVSDTLIFEQLHLTPEERDQLELGTCDCPDFECLHFTVRCGVHLELWQIITAEDTQSVTLRRVVRMDLPNDQKGEWKHVRCVGPHSHHHDQKIRWSEQDTWFMTCQDNPHQCCWFDGKGHLIDRREFRDFSSEATEWKISRVRQVRSIKDRQVSMILWTSSRNEVSVEKLSPPLPSLRPTQLLLFFLVAATHSRRSWEDFFDREVCAPRPDLIHSFSPHLQSSLRARRNHWRLALRNHPGPSVRVTYSRKKQNNL